MADDCTITQEETKKLPNTAVSKVVKTPVCHVVDRGSIPRQKEYLEPNTRFHQITVSIFDVSKFNPEKNVADDCKEIQSGNILIISSTSLLGKW